MKFTVTLDPPAHEMACEEIVKQIAFVKGIEALCISPGGDRIEFDAPAETGPALLAKVEAHARRIERVLRNVPRKVIFRSAAADHISFCGARGLDGRTLSRPGMGGSPGSSAASVPLFRSGF